MKRLVCVLVVVLLGIGCCSVGVAEENAGDEFFELMDRSAYQFAEDSIYWEDTSRSDPVPLWGTAWLKTRSPVKYVEVSIIEMLRGKNANELVKKANKFNDMPGKEGEYLYCKIRISMQCEDYSAKYKASKSDFKFVSAFGRTYKLSVAGLSDSIEIYSGAFDDIELAMLIPSDDNPLLVFDEDIWFSFVPLDDSADPEIL